MAKAEAFKIASQLTLGMREVDALHLLFQNGKTIDNVPGAGDSFGWYHSFLLADGCNLDLQITPQPFRPDGVWANGRLSAAFIRRHSATIVTIRLKNAP